MKASVLLLSFFFGLIAAWAEPVPPHGKFLFAAAGEGIEVLPTTAEISKEGDSNHTLEFRFAGKEWRGPITFRVENPSAEADNHFVFDVVATTKKQDATVLLSGKVSGKTLRGVIVYHTGHTWRNGFNHYSKTRTGSFSLNPHDAEQAEEADAGNALE